jgi:hypothetical protein
MYVVCVAPSGLCSFSSLPRVPALKRLTLGCYVWPFQGLWLLFQPPLLCLELFCPSAFQSIGVDPSIALSGTDPARFWQGQTQHGFVRLRAM